MGAIKHLLVPIDGSEGAIAAATFAGELARGLGARVTLLIVHNEDQLVPYAWGAGEWPVIAADAAVSIDELREITESAAVEKELAAAHKALGKLDTDAQLVQRWGHAAEEICRYAVDNEANMIVMGSRGRSGFTRLLLGSVSSQVVDHAYSAVTIVR